MNEGFWMGCIVATVVSFFVPSCSVDSEELARAQEVCANNKGVAAIRPEALMYQVKATCKNGATFKYVIRGNQ